MLTSRMRRVLLCIQDSIDETGVAPSFDEIQSRAKITSRGDVFLLMNALQERGFIRRLRFRARAVEILRRIEPKYAFHRVEKPEKGDARLVQIHT